MKKSMNITVLRDPVPVGKNRKEFTGYDVEIPDVLIAGPVCHMSKDGHVGVIINQAPSLEQEKLVRQETVLDRLAKHPGLEDRMIFLAGQIVNLSELIKDFDYHYDRVPDKQEFLESMYKLCNQIDIEVNPCKGYIDYRADEMEEFLKSLGNKLRTKTNSYVKP